MNEHGRIDIHIDELVVDGAQDIDRRRLAAAVEAELGHLVSRGGVRFEPATLSQVDGGTIAASRDAAAIDSSAVGRRVARAVHGAIGGKR